MIQTKQQLKECLKKEKQNYKNIRKLWRFFAFFGLNEQAIIWKYQRKLRIWEYHVNNHHKLRTLFYKTTCTKLGRKYGISICPNCFDVGLRIVHLGSILVNSETKVGKDCMLHINTAFVATGGTSDSPKLGDNCKIGVGATLVGGIHLGNEVVVGAGSVVANSFEENHITIAGVPAKIISRKAII